MAYEITDDEWDEIAGGRLREEDIEAKAYVPSPDDENYWQRVKQIGVVAFNQARKGVGKRIKNPSDLWAYACDYFEQTEKNPLQKTDFIRGGEMAGAVVRLDAMRAFTWNGFNAYLVKMGIISGVLSYKQNPLGRYDEYQEVVKAIDSVMWSQKFEGAAAGLLSAGIIARELQLADKTVTEHTGTVRQEVDWSKISDEALAEIAMQSQLNALNTAANNPPLPQAQPSETFLSPAHIDTSQKAQKPAKESKNDFKSFEINDYDDLL